MPQEKPQGTKAGQYYLLEKIAQGGMAEIFKGLAYDLAGIKKTVCIKKILSHIAASREFIDMLVDEAKIAVKLSHGSIAQIYDLGKAGDDYFIVMEYVEGQTLSKIHKKSLRMGKRVPLPIVCYIISEIASGLNYMHRKTDEEGNPLNIIHRDISPQNIMVSYSGTVKIIDFGIAKAAVKVGHTDSGILKGKFAYMSPEQAHGDRLDHRSDIFSLGILFHELLTGKRLFKGSSNKQTLRNVKRVKVPAPSEIDPEIPKALDKIVLKALSKDRRLRHPFASDFQDDLIRFLHTHFPDFRPAMVAEFAQKLFEHELTLSQDLREAEGATPHLILEKTKTSLNANEEKSEITSQKAGGIDWREFMLEEDWPDEKEAPIKEREREGEEREEESFEKEKTDRKGILKHPSVRKTAFAMSILTVFLLGYFGWDFFLSDRPLPPPPMDTGEEERPEESMPATLVIQSTPPGATIYLGDKNTGFKTPRTITFEDPGEETPKVLGLYREGYQFYKTDITVSPGATDHFHIQLAIDYGNVRITSVPSGASVFLDGTLVGKTPLTQERLKPGRIARIEIRREGFLPYTAEIKVLPGKDHRIHTRLESAQRLPPP